MKITLNVSDFKYELKDIFESEYKNCPFSDDAIEELFYYYKDIEDITDEEIEFDPIDICKNWTEYKSLKQIKEKYDVKNIQELEKQTNVIGFDTGYLVENY